MQVSFSVLVLLFLCFCVLCMFLFVAPDFGCTKVDAAFVAQRASPSRIFEYGVGCIKGGTNVNK